MGGVLCMIAQLEGSKCQSLRGKQLASLVIILNQRRIHVYGGFERKSAELCNIVRYDKIRDNPAVTRHVSDNTFFHLSIFHMGTIALEF